MKRALTASQAGRCENAKQSRCACRCGGLLHGARRGDVHGLPEGDPHRPNPKQLLLGPGDPDVRRLVTLRNTLVRETFGGYLHPDLPRISGQSGG